jgi:hexokinase
MENTYVPELPNGREEGTYLALDLGGTNFRVMLMEMAAGRIVREEVAYYSVQEETRLGPGSS